MSENRTFFFDLGLSQEFLLTIFNSGLGAIWRMVSPGVDKNEVLEGTANGTCKNVHSNA